MFKSCEKTNFLKVTGANLEVGRVERSKERDSPGAAIVSQTEFQITNPRRRHYDSASVNHLLSTEQTTLGYIDWEV